MGEEHAKKNKRGTRYNLSGRDGANVNTGSFLGGNCRNPCNLSAEIAPYMLLINRVECDLDITGTTATAKCYVTGDPNAATKAKIIAELQVKNGSSWIPVKIWTVTEDSYSARVKETYTITQGNTYRLKATMTVWEGSQSETQIVYSS